MNFDERLRSAMQRGDGAMGGPRVDFQATVNKASRDRALRVGLTAAVVVVIAVVGGASARAIWSSSAPPKLDLGPAGSPTAEEPDRPPDGSEVLLSPGERIEPSLELDCLPGPPALLPPQLESDYPPGIQDIRKEIAVAVDACDFGRLVELAIGENGTFLYPGVSKDLQPKPQDLYRYFARGGVRDRLMRFLGQRGCSITRAGDEGPVTLYRWPTQACEDGQNALHVTFSRDGDWIEARL